MRTLLVHQDEDFSERGVSLSVSYNPTPSTPLGFVARVAPSWGGQATSGAQALWGRETMGGMAHGGLAQGNRLDGEVGYGLPVGRRFVGTPRVGFSTSEYGQDYRVGYGLGVLDRQMSPPRSGFPRPTSATRWTKRGRRIVAGDSSRQSNRVGSRPRRCRRNHDSGLGPPETLVRSGLPNIRYRTQGRGGFGRRFPPPEPRRNRPCKAKWRRCSRQASPLPVVELQEVTFSGQRSTGLIDDMRIAVIPSRHHGADAGGCAPAG